ncbi:MAG: hypothetical protein IPJ07_17115 [Acidobacteria bacterium]|nr:hypothetical protein [Acidobacteriota bacterium]
MDFRQHHFILKEPSPPLQYETVGLCRNSLLGRFDEFQICGWIFQDRIQVVSQGVFTGWIYCGGGAEFGRIRHLHAHFCHTATTVAMFAAKLSEVPFSFTAHAKDIYRTDMNPGDLLSRKLQRAEFAVTCTKANYDYLDRLKPATSRLYRIYHGIDLKLFTSSNNNRSSGPPLILSVGRFVEKKGFTYLVEACRFLKDEGVSFICRHDWRF